MPTFPFSGPHTAPNFRPLPSAPTEKGSTGSALDVDRATGQGRRNNKSAEQGRALEVLGHAIEYLVDSRLFLVEEPYSLAETEATQILMVLSRQVFEDYTDVAPPMHRLRRWIRSEIPAGTAIGR